MVVKETNIYLQTIWHRKQNETTFFG